MEEASSDGVILECLLCPSAPMFCDVSHLLTHVGSKGHLSHQHKLGIRGQSDPTAQSKLEMYQHWYSRNGIQKLLGERLAIKDSKRAQVDQRPKKQTATSQTAVPTSQEKEIKYDSKVLYDPFRIIGPKELDPLDESAKLSPSDQSGEDHRADMPKMYLWSTVKKDPSTPSFNRFGLHARPISPREESFENHQVNRDDAGINTFREHITEYTNMPCLSGFSDSARWSGQLKSSTADNIAVSGNVNPAHQLKGRYWPGMDLFDAATPEMRRKRNQRKDPSVLERMQQSSKSVEAKEVIYRADGSFLRARQFSEEDSEDFVDSSSIKAKRNPKRAVLVRKSTNANRKSALKKTAKKSLTKALNHNSTYDLSLMILEVEPVSLEPLEEDVRNHNGSGVLDDEDLELSLTLGRHLDQKKPILSIFDKASSNSAGSGNEELKPGKASIRHSGEASRAFGHPQGLNMLNSGISRMPRGQRVRNAREDSSATSSIPNAGTSNQSHTEKENIEPIYTRDGKIEDIRLGDTDTSSRQSLDQDYSTIYHSASIFTQNGYMDLVSFQGKQLRPFASPLASSQWPLSFPPQQVHPHFGEAFQERMSVFDEAMATQESCV
jgi:hypothetical protein